MLQLPVSKLLGLISSISVSIRKINPKISIEVSDVKLLSFIPDIYLRNSPLIICNVQCELLLAKRPEIAYYSCLIDLLRVKVVGTPIRTHEKGIQIQKIDNVLYKLPRAFRFGVDVKGFTPYHGHVLGFSLYCGNNEFQVGQFIESLKRRDIRGSELNTYEKWVLEFLSKRESLILLREFSCYGLAKTSCMTEYRAQLEVIKGHLEKDIADLLDNYPGED